MQRAGAIDRRRKPEDTVGVEQRLNRRGLVERRIIPNPARRDIKGCRRLERGARLVQPTQIIDP